MTKFKLKRQLIYKTGPTVLALMTPKYVEGAVSSPEPLETGVAALATLMSRQTEPSSSLL